MTDEYSTTDLARICRVSEQTARRYAVDGRIAHRTTPGGHYRFTVGAVQAFMAEHGMPAEWLAEYDTTRSTGD